MLTPFNISGLCEINEAPDLLLENIPSCPVLAVFSYPSNVATQLFPLSLPELVCIDHVLRSRHVCTIHRTLSLMLDTCVPVVLSRMAKMAHMWVGKTRSERLRFFIHFTFGFMKKIHCFFFSRFLSKCKVCYYVTLSLASFY